MATAPGRKGWLGGVWTGYRQVLKRRSLALLWLGQTVSWFGDSLYSVSPFWLVQDMTGSRAMMGVVAACRTIPQLLLVLSGALADRWDRRRPRLHQQQPRDDQLHPKTALGDLAGDSLESDHLRRLGRISRV